MLNAWLKTIARVPGLADFMALFATMSYFSGQFIDFAKDPGVGWHLKTGELIATTSEIPTSDPFLFSATPRPWVSDQWLSDLLLYWLYQLGSWPLLYALFTVMSLSGFLLVLYPAVSRHAGSWLAGCFAVTLALRMGQVHFILRPVGFSFLFFALAASSLYRLHDKIRGEGTSDFGKKLWLGLPLLFAIWANMHPSFVLGLLLMALLPASLILDGIFQGGRVSTGVTGKLCLLLIACLLATFINPYTFELHQSIMSLGSSEYFLRLNREWHSPDFTSHFGRILEIILALMVFFAFVCRANRRKLCFFDLLPLLLFCHAGLQAIRFFPYLGIIAAFPLARTLAGAGELQSSFSNSRFWTKLCEYFSGLEALERRGNKGRLVLLVAFTLILGDALLNQRLLTFNGPFGPGEDNYPGQAFAALKQDLMSQHPDAQVVAIASTPNWGGFITWHGYPQIRAVIDDRNTLLGEQAYKDYLEKLKPGQPWREYLKDTGAAYLLIEKDSAIGASIKEAGSLPIVYEDKVAILFRYER